VKGIKEESKSVNIKREERKRTEEKEWRSKLIIKDY
jgi:hypothetical protein